MFISRLIMNMTMFLQHEMLMDTMCVTSTKLTNHNTGTWLCLQPAM